ncbi:MAG: hypothetical protein LBC97_11120 [Bifidobacteriaceae bacterium]|jgi:hypothetical protein|nr:hypothetical protein [Bifidobacteriaceae bacterium]
MRTTLDLDPKVLAVARSLASHERISLGAAVSRLAARGFETPRIGVNEDGFPVLADAPDDRVITNELVAEHRDGDPT